MPHFWTVRVVFHLLQHTYIYNLHLSWNYFHPFIFSLSWWCFRMSRTVMNYDSSFLDVRPYRNTSSTIIFDATFFKPRSLAIVSHFICSFIIVAAPVVITFRRLFPSGVKNVSISYQSSSAATCQYQISISTTIKYFVSVSMCFTTSSQQSMWMANGGGTCFSFL